MESQRAFDGGDYNTTGHATVGIYFGFCLFCADGSREVSGKSNTLISDTSNSLNMMKTQGSNLQKLMMEVLYVDQQSGNLYAS